MRSFLLSAAARRVVLFVAVMQVLGATAFAVSHDDGGGARVRTAPSALSDDSAESDGAGLAEERPAPDGPPEFVDTVTVPPDRPPSAGVVRPPKGLVPDPKLPPLPAPTVPPLGGTAEPTPCDGTAVPLDKGHGGRHVTEFGVYTATPDGAATKRVATMHDAGAWSKDGRRVLYWAGLPRSPENSLCVLDVLSGRVRQVAANTPISLHGPGVFAQWADNDTRVVALFGKSVVAVDVATGVVKTVYSGGDVNAFSVSRDQKRVAVGVNGSRVVVVNTDGSGEKKLADVPHNHYVVSFRWSPSGSHVAWSQGGEVFTARADAGEAPAHFGAEALAIDWSPDGTQVAYTAEHGLYVADRDGANWRQIRDGFHATLAWGSFPTMLYTTRDGAKVSLRAIKPDGSGDQTLITAESPGHERADFTFVPLGEGRAPDGSLRFGFADIGY